MRILVKFRIAELACFDPGSSTKFRGSVQARSKETAGRTNVSTGILYTTILSFMACPQFAFGTEIHIASLRLGGNLPHPSFHIRRAWLRTHGYTACSSNASLELGCENSAGDFLRVHCSRCDCCGKVHAQWVWSGYTGAAPKPSGVQPWR